MAVPVLELAGRAPNAATRRLRDRLARSSPPFKGMYDLVVDALFGLPSLSDWLERENGHRGRGEAMSLADPVARGAWIGLSPADLNVMATGMVFVIVTRHIDKAVAIPRHTAERGLHDRQGEPDPVRDLRARRRRHSAIPQVLRCGSGGVAKTFCPFDAARN